jgi:uncharacterized protein
MTDLREPSTRPNSEEEQAGEPLCNKVVFGRAHGKGLGVFAASAIFAGEVIERAPVIVVCESGRGPVNPDSPIDHYYFRWGKDDDGLAIALGYGSLYNHSYQPNAVYVCLMNQRIIEFSALRNIRPGEEITVNYNRDPKDKSALWFEVK